LAPCKSLLNLLPLGNSSALWLPICEILLYSSAYLGCSPSYCSRGY
jgi:hypothetical protein